MEYPEYPQVDYDPHELTKIRDLFGLMMNEVLLGKAGMLESAKPKVCALLMNSAKSMILLVRSCGDPKRD